MQAIMSMVIMVRMNSNTFCRKFTIPNTKPQSPASA